MLGSMITKLVVFSNAVNAFNNELGPSGPGFHPGLSHGFTCRFP